MNRELGVGLVYWSALDPLFESGSEAVSVLELEPEAWWEKVALDGGWAYRANEAVLDRIAALPQPRLLHGVGHPLGGTVGDPIAHRPLMRRIADRLDPAWVSEHLSFNRIRQGGSVDDAGFLLPPPQCPAAVRVAADNIAGMRKALGRAVAFETGVNYLRPAVGEMADGQFFAAVAESADSGILLDLHNLWCNQCNGRQSVEEAVSQLPLDRVWEMHLAGGMSASGYWLDAHSGPVPAEVIDLAAALIPRLPNLGALIFEILPEHLPAIGLDGVQRQLEVLQPLWRSRPARQIRVAQAPATRAAAGAATEADRAQVAAWECALAQSLRRPPPIFDSDSGTELLRGLIGEFRRANLTRTLRYTMISLLAGLGVRETHALLTAYFESGSPDPFAAVEADRFADFLSRLIQSRGLRVPHLDEVLAFEQALLRATLFGAASELAWSVDPTRLFESLDAGALPGALPAVASRMCIG